MQRYRKIQPAPFEGSIPRERIQKAVDSVSKDDTMPDFEEWVKNLVFEYVDYECYHGRVEEALKQAFDQGYALGYRGGKRDGYYLGSQSDITNTQEWWEDQDNDAAWVNAHEPTLEEVDREILVQVRNPRNKMYYLINKESGTIGEHGSRTRHIGIRLVTSPTEE